MVAEYYEEGKRRWRIMQLVGVLEGIHLHSRNVKLEDERDSLTVLNRFAQPERERERSLALSLSLFLVFLVFAQVGGCFLHAFYLFIIYF